MGGGRGGGKETVGALRYDGHLPGQAAISWASGGLASSAGNILVATLAAGESLAPSNESVKQLLKLIRPIRRARVCVCLSVCPCETWLLQGIKQLNVGLVQVASV